ncbi:hypothetical protein JRO89_XS06G0011300 [Xanthoceras sorbifolium]|uniref:SH3 domain-containing protein n=1 Tax=Xanthoceras sorbifolium TaxID=99658 RepID=A0ABQ8HW93_9ROSI|nr:hypothetical protein JRO89_XS06G0011300 [Xanthoceras sorbifolium]
MANSRITRFVMEVAPPQFVSVMRHRSRTAKMLDTISEEERDGMQLSWESIRIILIALSSKYTFWYRIEYEGYEGFAAAGLLKWSSRLVYYIK